MPPGSIRIDQVWVDGQPWSEFDSEHLTVTLPPPGAEHTVKVRVVSALETFESEVQVSDGTASIVLSGKLDETVAWTLERDLERALQGGPQRVVLRAEQLESMSSAGARALLLLRQKLPNGRYELPEPRHSWNTNHIYSNLVSFHLQRHSDHHANSLRPYQALRDFKDLPRLPSGYPGSFGLASIPWLWFKVMDPKLMEWAGGDITRVNVDPKRKAKLYAKYGGQVREESPAAMTSGL